ncbi:unnamed protein product [Cylindrotheca closterium]|uniref:Uncharacterized protein n=1 Tax=Cylindrotheca closterium TaxID=2856 RepID=A0AAD2FFU3_9STRA|nr:unnamed protein product [Cylindrotheca closterium]
MANHNNKGLFGRILRAFRSSCGTDDDAWADLSPWDLCVNSYSGPQQPPNDIPRVVSITDEASDMVSGLHTINQTRGPVEQKSSFESEADLSEIFAFKTIRKRPESKQKRRDSPPSQEYESITHGLPSQYVHLGQQQNLPVALMAEQPRQEEKVVGDIPRNIYTRPRVQHHIVRL